MSVNNEYFVKISPSKDVTGSQLFSICLSDRAIVPITQTTGYVWRLRLPPVPLQPSLSVPVGTVFTDSRSERISREYKSNPQSRALPTEVRRHMEAVLVLILRLSLIYQFRHMSVEFVNLEYESC